MGFKVEDITPLSLNAPVTTPPSKDMQVKAFQVLRTDTTATLKAGLPADASILYMQVVVGTASNAGTTGAITVTATNVAGTTLMTVAQSTQAAGSFFPSNASYVNIEPVPVQTTGDIYLRATYAETGTASTAGGPFTVLVYYVR